jgi:hypothetical protein
MRLAVLATPTAFDAGHPAPAPLRTLQRAVDYKRNPRSREYMRALLAEEGGDWTLLEVERADEVPIDAVAAADRILLLWPDANGYGWRDIEARVLSARRPGVPIEVLNGRRRRFPLTPAMHRRFVARRAVQRLWLGETAFVAAGVVAGLPLMLWDAARGHR